MVNIILVLLTNKNVLRIKAAVNYSWLDFFMK